jgi:hypothetical protein
MLSARSLQGINIVVSGLGRGFHGVAVQGMGGNQKGPPGGGGGQKQISRVGGSTPIRLCEGHPPLMERFESYSNLTELKKLLYNHFDLETISN